MKTTTRIFTVLVLLQLCCYNSFAQIHTLCIKGVVTYVDDMNNALSGNIAVGDSINGIIKYDLATTDNNTAMEVADYYHSLPPAGIWVTINGQSFLTDSTNVNFLVETVNDYNGNDNIVMHSYNNTIAPPVSGLGYNTMISWQLDDTAETALSNTNIPTFINVSAWQQMFGLTITSSSSMGDTNIFIRAVVTSVDTCEGLMTFVENLPGLEKLTVTPNPFNSSTIIQFNSPVKNGELIIYNVHGQEINTVKNISGNEIKISRDNLPAGIYLIRLAQDGKIISTCKLIVTD
ncbi:MAG TPA: T9SS type A sorting domain-containing protein [Bacteroidia bacterium]|nr:T9SS type A sorting domain-containing protein [Bacteroidia bacterium]